MNSVHIGPEHTEMVFWLIQQNVKYYRLYNCTELKHYKMYFLIVPHITIFQFKHKLILLKLPF